MKLKNILTTSIIPLILGGCSLRNQLVVRDYIPNGYEASATSREFIIRAIELETGQNILFPKSKIINNYHKADKFPNDKKIENEEAINYYINTLVKTEYKREE